MTHPLARLTAALLVAGAYYVGLSNAGTPVAMAAADPQIVRDIEESQTAFSAGRYTDALGPTDRLTVALPSQALYFDRLARIHKALEHPKEEAAAWEGVYRTSPTPSDACPMIAEAYGRVPDKARALDAYERCVTVDPTNPDMLLFVGRAYSGAGRAAEARKVLEEALRLAPDYPDVYLVLGVRHFADGHVDEARRAFEKFLALSPQRRAEVAVWLERTHSERQ